ncbi:DMT family transporter [Paenibacillus beijingensis]|uniref:Membrane protein n=1 Tax=Paenibacillus beijingensis TaxID=1126833 RepID=A0A0D5NP65_9BACL|nr:EamA family transporter [Paenibacillus beijingensis]AJY76955.1 membrane protein [Paenibacillus beijingensis]
MKNSMFAVLILFNTLVAGLNFPIGKMGLEFASPLLLLGLRFIAAGLLMLPFVVKRPHPHEPVRWLQIGMIGLFQSALVLGFIYLSMKTIPSSTSSILSSTNPIWFIIFSTLFLGIHYRTVQWTGAVLGFIGVVVTTQGFSFQFHIGALLALFAGMTWAMATLLTSRWGKHFDTLVMTTYQMLIGGAILLIASVFFEQPWFALDKTQLAKELFVLAWLVLMSSIGQFVSWFYILKISDPGKASAFLFLVPLFGVLSGWLILGEELHWYVWAGAASIGFGIYLINKPRQTPVSSISADLTVLPHQQ